MRVCLFFDGKNHMKDLRRAAADRWLNHGALADWAVQQVGGTRMVAAYYYTGVPNPNDDASERHALTDLLEELDGRPGFFVRRFNRRATSRACPHCNEQIAYTEEKQVDTSLVTDLVMLAVQDAFDVAVVFSGDLDVAPGLDAVHRLGKQAWIATFGDNGMSRSLRRSAWNMLDLAKHIDDFAYPELSETTPSRGVPDAPDRVDAEVLRELRRAETHFAAGGGFVGAHYFIHRWKGHAIPESPEERRESLQRLMTAQLVIAYQSEGKTALKTAQPGNGNGGGADDLEETVEASQIEVVRRRTSAPSSS